MKKVLFILLMAILVAGITSCDGNKKQQSNTTTEQVADSSLVVEDLISMDREAMTLEFTKNYKWYETCIVNQDNFDSNNASTPVVVEVTNIFQCPLNNHVASAEMQVVEYTHTKDTTTMKVNKGFWLGDQPMNNEKINLTYTDAYAKMMATNLPKPHSKQCVLRKELGPKKCNPQYIFGNKQAQIYVDAITGNVTDKNPAYEGFGDVEPPAGQRH